MPRVAILANLDSPTDELLAKLRERRGQRPERERPSAAPPRRRATVPRRRGLAARRATPRRCERASAPGDFEEPLERLLKSYRDEAELTTLGRITVRELIVSLLENLLRSRRSARANPAIEREQIADPVFIIGLPRTGTTHLHGLDQPGPRRTARRSRGKSCTPPRAGRDAARDRSVRARDAMRVSNWANRLAPEFMRIHPIAPDLPQECIAITAQMFMSIQFHTTHNVPSYQDWFEDAVAGSRATTSTVACCSTCRRSGPGNRWVLKAPGHLFALGGLLRRYPNARIVQTHRDPLRVMASMASHATVLRRAFSDRADPRQIAADWTDRWARALDDFSRGARPRARRAVPGRRATRRSSATPLGTIERVYDFLGWPLTAEARAAIDAFPRGEPEGQARRASLHARAVRARAAPRKRARFRGYCERFGIAVT